MGNLIDATSCDSRAFTSTFCAWPTNDLTCLTFPYIVSREAGHPSSQFVNATPFVDYSFQPFVPPFTSLGQSDAAVFTAPGSCVPNHHQQLCGTDRARNPGVSSGFTAPAQSFIAAPIRIQACNGMHAWPQCMAGQWCCRHHMIYIFNAHTLL